MNEIELTNPQLETVNFRGESSRFNPSGHRNIVVRLSEEDVPKLQEAGLRIQYLGAEETEPAMKISVNFANPDISVQMARGIGNIEVNETFVHMLDYVGPLTIEKLTVCARPWSHEDRKGVKAFIQQLIVRLP